MNAVVLMGDSTIVLSGRERSCYQVAKPWISYWNRTNPGSPKIYTKIDSKIYSGGDVDNSLEKISKHRDPQAFGSGIGASAPSQRLSSPTPSERVVKSKLIRLFQAVILQLAAVV